MPSTVGRYRIDRVLGSGAFASVWLAHDDVLDAPVAVKVLSGGLIDDLDVRGRFLEEAKILRRADSERLVRVHDIGELDDGRPYFVMSYADRGTLAERMRGRELPLPEALRLAMEVAYGVEVINRLGIIHRDLKPSNVLFQSTTDGGERLLIADLGLAKALAHASGAFTLPVGTPGYMSPEQARFGGGLDVRADVYGLGALTYHLLTGRSPGTAPVQVPPSAVRPGLPQILDEIVMRALAADREHRWPTAGAFAAALGVPLNTMSAGPVSSGPPGPPPDATTRDHVDSTVRDPGPGHTVQVPSSGGTSSMRTPPLDGSEPTLTDLRPADHLPPKQPAEREPRRKWLLILAGLVVTAIVLGGGAYGIAKLTGSDKPDKKKSDGLVAVTDTSGAFSLRVPPAWKLQPQQNTWPSVVPITDRAKAPALRATPDYARFVRDAEPVPGVFAGLTHDLKATLPPARLGSHQGKCTAGAARTYQHGSLRGQVTPWRCGQITISEAGLKDTSGRYAMWVRVKVTSGPDITDQILNSITVKRP